MKSRLFKIFILLFGTLFVLACGISGTNTSSTATVVQSATAVAQTATIVAVSPMTATVTETVTPQFSLPTKTAIPSQTPAAPKDLPTLTPMPTFATPTPTPTATPTFTPTASQTPGTGTVPPTTEASATAIPGTPTTRPTYTSDELKAKIASANILVLDDAGKNGQLIPRVDKVLTKLGIKGSNVVDTLDAYGKFLNLLKSDTPWDLIIVATEDRNEARPGIWDAVLNRVNNKAALIVENWYLNEINIGQITPLLQQCGIDVEKNWERSPSSSNYLYAIYAVDPNNEIFQNPNKIEFPMRPHIYWMGDVGDLLKVTNPDTAKVLAGIYTADAAHSGLITSCFDGRVVFQTFSTHDYDRDITTQLWENYIINTLTNHFNAMP